MARNTQHQWNLFAHFSSRRRKQQRRTLRQPYQRQLRIEPLEDRRLLSKTVNTLIDVNANDGLTTLREAIAAAASGETILFAASLTSGGPAAIQLTNVGHAGEIVIKRNVTINGPGADLLTIQAFDPTPDMNNGDGSRVFRIDDGISNNIINVSIIGLALTGGDPTSNSATGDGGAIFTRENLAVNDSTITGNSANQGGGIAGAYGSIVTVSNSTISGNSAGRNGGGVYAYGGISTITGCTISGNSAGSDGGGIHSLGNLDLVDSFIADNTAQYGGGVYGRSGTIARSSITGNIAAQSGGGVSFGGDISDSTIKYNQAKYGGGISGSGTITNTVIYLNTAGNDGGGVWNNQGPLVNCTINENDAGRDGGGVWASGGQSGTTTVLDGCTVSFNTAGRNGGGMFGGRGLFGSQMVNTTVTGNSALNGGGMFLFDIIQFAVRHSTVVSNSASFDFGFGHGIFFAGGPLTLDHSIVSNVLTFYGQSVEAHYSIVSSNAGSPLAEAPIGMPDANGNLIGGPIHGIIDPLLGPLGDNGTLLATHALLPGSPALDAGDLAAAPGVGGVPQFDGRGAPFARIAGGRIDIGAFERQSLPAGTLTVDTLVDEEDGYFGPGDLSLREAIHLAVGSIGPDTITFAPALTAAGPASIILTHGGLGIGTSLSIIGTGADLLTIDASGNDPTPTSTLEDGDDNDSDGSGVFVVRGPGFPEADIDVTMSGLTITGADGGSGINGSFCNLTVSESRITGNILTGSGASGYGGGIYFSGGALKIYDSSITHNTADGGGGIFAGGFGGGYFTSLEIHNSVISDNVAGHGGGIWALNTNPWIITGSTVSNNRGFHGGGILTWSDLTVRASTISGNLPTLGGFGGGISSGNFYGDPTIFNTITVIDSTISGNRTLVTGGGIFTGGTVNVTRSTIANNGASNILIPVAGGGIWAGQIVLNHAIVANNAQDDVYGNGTATFSLIGNKGSATITDDGTNLIGTVGATINPMLGPLADNGGPTLPDGSKMLTHALLAGSPAIDAGNPSAVAGVGGVPQFDQRGAPFTRVFGGRIDIGALELQPTPPILFGDYNHNGVVDGADYTVWRDHLGSHPSPYSGADGSGNGVVDVADYALWTAHFGQVVPVAGAGSGAKASSEERGASFGSNAELHYEAQGLASQTTAAQASSGTLAEPIGQPLRTSGEDERASQGENPPPGLAPRSSFLAPNRPFIGSLQNSGPALAASQRNEALLTWLALHPNGQPRRDDFGHKTTYEDQATDERTEFRFDAVDEVFGTLSVGV